jgi:hypothetical protein
MLAIRETSRVHSIIANPLRCVAVRNTSFEDCRNRVSIDTPYLYHHTPAQGRWREWGWGVRRWLKRRRTCDESCPTLGGPVLRDQGQRQGQWHERGREGEGGKGVGESGCQLERALSPHQRQGVASARGPTPCSASPLAQRRTSDTLVDRYVVLLPIAATTPAAPRRPRQPRKIAVGAC